MIARAVWLMLGVAMLLYTPAPSWSHAGHDDTEPHAPAGQRAPRADASSTDFEIVAVAADHRLTITLDRFATNAPITDAVVEVAENGGDPVKAEKQDDGTYRLSAPWLNVAGKHDLIFTVIDGETSDLLTGVIELPATARPPSGPPASAGAWLRAALGAALGEWAATLMLALAFLLGALSVITIQTRGMSRAASGALAVLAGVMIAGVALAQRGIDNGDSPAPPLAVLDVPRRQPDGTVAMPKDAQRLLAVQTLEAAETKASRTIQIIGQVMPDPNAAGRVQSSQPGRIEAPTITLAEKGLAHLGQWVKAGDMLAVIQPAIAAVERGTAGAQVADAEQQVRIAEQKLARLSGLVGSVAGKEIDEARAELAGARARRTAATQTLAGREILRAPVSGIVSVANAVAGQFVEAKDILFEIVDPTRLWIEATGFDPQLAGDMRGASAVLPDGTPIRIELVGRGLALRQGATPLLFRILSPPPGLSVGTPVSVIAQIAVDATGIRLPRASVVRMANGGSAVWDHVSGERFVPRPVRLQALDGANVLILAGLKPGQRIVTQGADLLNQVR